jgi:hypothetical protein
MDDAAGQPDEGTGESNDQHRAEEFGLTLERYAHELALPLDWLKGLGLATIDNPWATGRKAVAIPYRQRDGILFRNRIRQAANPVTTPGRKPLWDKRPERLGAMLYGLDQLPAPGCPVLLVDDEAACQVLWHHGFDAIATQGEGGYVVKRDDPELEDFDITVIAPAEELLRRLSSKPLSPSRISPKCSFSQTMRVTNAGNWLARSSRSPSVSRKVRPFSTTMAWTTTSLPASWIWLNRSFSSA